MTPTFRQVRTYLRSAAKCVLLRGAVLMSAMVASAPALTVDFIWTGALSSDFNTAGNWSAGSVPGSTGLDIRVTIDLPGAITVNVPTSSTNTINWDLRIGVDDTLNIANAATFNVAGGGAVTNNGKLSLSSTFHNTNLVITSGTVTFGGTGAIELGNHPANRIYGAASTDHLINAAGHTIKGAGQVGVGLLTLTNQGLILANSTNSLQILPSSGGLTNTGTLRATNGATLVLQGATFTNTGGLIEADDTSHVDLNSAAIVGGTLTSHGTGHLHANSNSSLSGLTISSGSNVEVPNSHRLFLAGTIANSGTINLLSSFHLTDLVSSGNVTLSGGGAISLGNHPNNRLVGSAATDVLTNENNTISGAGQIGADFMGFVNRATVIANLSNALTVDPSSAGVVNRGTLRAADGATLNLSNGTFTNSEGGIGGTIEALAASFVNLNGASIVGGTLATAGDGLFQNVGTATLQGVTMASGAALSANNATVTTVAGSLANFGNLSLLSNFHHTDLRMSGGDVTLSGTGTISFSNHPNNRIVGTVATDRLINTGNTIQGAGQIGANFVALTNRGTIQATYNAGNALTIDLAGAANVNAGTIQATTGATLTFSDTTLTNTEGAVAGVIRAQGGTVQIHGGTVIVGGNIDVASSGEVQLNASTLQGSSLVNSSTGIVRATGGLSILDGINFTNSAGGQFIFDNDADVRFTASGTYSNAGTIALNSTFHLTDLIVSGGDVTFGGGGTIRLGDHPNNRIYGAAAGDRLVNENNTIEGAGQLGVDLMGLVNRGVVVANRSNSLTLNPSTAGVVNRGTLRGSDGVLNLVDGTFTNSESGVPGRIEAWDNGRVDLNGAVMIGGRFSTQGTGVIRNVGTATLDGVTIESGGKFVNVNDADTTLLGTLSNSGTLSLTSSFHNTDLIIGSGTVTLSGGGTIALSDHPNNRIYGSAATHILINSDNSIVGSGQIGVDFGGIINRHVIAATQGNPLTIDPSAAGVVNRGTLRADGGVLNLFGGTYTNSESGVSGTIEARPGSSVDLSGAHVIGGSLTTSGDGVLRNIGVTTLQDVMLTGGSAFSAVNDADTFLVGTLTNFGTLSLNSSFHNTDLVLGSGDVTLTGGGTIAFSNHPNNRIYASAPTHRLINENNLIQGAGQIGVNTAGLINRGTILANQSNALTIDPSGTGVLNRGTLRADAATLNLIDGTFTNSESGTGGLIEAIANGRVDLNGATLIGGTLASAGGGLLRNVGTATLENITLSAGSNLFANNATITTLNGTLNNFGTVSLNSSFHNTDLVISSGGATLQGSGVLVLSNHPNNRIYGTALLTNAAGHTIRGSGQLGVDLLTLTNLGTIEANQSNALTVNLSNGSSFVNQGVLRATNGGNLVFADALTNSGIVHVETGSTFTAQSTFTQSTGATILQTATFSAASSAFQGGVLQGSGTINGPATNSGVISPGTNGTGHGIGTLTFNHSLNLGATSLLHLELGGVNSVDRIHAQSIALGGTLAVGFANGFQFSIQPSDTFTLLSTVNASGLGGTFLGLANGSRFATLDGIGTFQINYLANSLTLSNFAVVIPEPSTYVLFGAGIIAVLVIEFRRRRS